MLPHRNNKKMLPDFFGIRFMLFGCILNFRFGKSSINAVQMNVMRRNDDATGSEAGYKKNIVMPLYENLKCTLPLVTG